MKKIISTERAPKAIRTLFASGGLEWLGVP